MRRLEVLQEPNQGVTQPGPLVVLSDAWNRDYVLQAVLHRGTHFPCRCPEDHSHDDTV